MKRIAFLVLALIANVIADEKENIQRVAAFFQTDTQMVESCLNKAGTNMEKVYIAMDKWDKITEDKDINKETEESLTTSGDFIACLLEKKDMMKDSKLVVDRILKLFHKGLLNKESLTPCLTSLNENIDLTREIRAFAFLFCSFESMGANEK